MAPRRQKVISRSITYSILHSNRKPGFFKRLPAYFYIYWLRYECIEESVFKELRQSWEIDENDYRECFEGKHALSAMGDMGYSGSTFFTTRDGGYLIKSVPRRFEHTFFRDDLLHPYAEYIQDNPHSLLIRITEFLQCAQHSIGTIFGLAPSHHIVMENIKRGESENPPENEKWESWDLKPMSYFYPERDVAGGALSSEATRSKLADDFDEKIVLTLDQAEEFKGQLEKDTALLAKHNAVDYSLYLVRMPAGSTRTASKGEESWRNGVPSADGKHVYRAAILDFFWAKHTVHAKAMTGLINSYNVVDPQGPMSVTAEAPEYRERFLRMCQEFVEVQGEEST